jgi:hypothetical protein
VPLDVPTTAVEDVNVPVQEETGTLHKAWSFIKSLVGELSEELIASLVVYLFAQRRSHKKKLEGLNIEKGSSSHSPVHLKIDNSVIIFVAVIFVGIAAIGLPMYYMSTHQTVTTEIVEHKVIVTETVQEPEPEPEPVVEPTVVTVQEPVTDTEETISPEEQEIIDNMADAISMSSTLLLLIVAIAILSMIMRLAIFEM